MYKPSLEVSRAVLLLQSKCPEEWQLLLAHLREQHARALDACQSEKDEVSLRMSQGHAQAFHRLSLIEEDARRLLD